MSVRSAASKSAWEDRFRTPTVQDLFESCRRQISSLIESVRDRLLSKPGMSEAVEWQGLPWRWTMTYSNPSDPSHAWAYLVPDPEKPVLSIPMTSEMVDSMPLHRMKKHVRDGVLTSRQVDGVYWASWELTSKAQLQDVLELVERKHTYLSGPSASKGRSDHAPSNGVSPSGRGRQ